jgi:tetratricopeptide (TPR) repeat protein
VQLEFPFFGRVYALSQRFIYPILILWVFLFYGNTIKNTFALDDELVTCTDRQEHPFVSKGIAGIPKIFTSTYASNEEQNYEYRPLVLTSFAIEKSVFGSSEAWVHISHFIQLLLYALLGIVLFSTLKTLFGPSKHLITFVITLLFLSLPIHSEVVNSLKNRDELLSMLFSMLALRSALRFVDSRKWNFLLFTLLYLLLALLSKKTAMPMLVIIPIALVYFRSFSWKSIAFISASVFGARILFGVLKKGLIETEKIREFSIVENPAFEYSFVQRIPLFFDSVIWYIKQSILPLDLQCYYGLGSFTVSSAFTLKTFAIGMVLLFTLGLILWAVVKKVHTELSFGLVFFFLAIVGACNLIFPMVGIVGERLAFTASLGLCITIVFLLNQYSTIKGNIAPLLFMVFCGYSLSMVFIRNSAWSDRLSLYEADSSTTKSAKVHALLGQELQYQINQSWNDVQSENQKAIYSSVNMAKQAYENALHTYPDYYKIQNNLATIESSFRCDERAALSIFKALTKKQPDYQEAWKNRLVSLLRIYIVWKRNEAFLTDKSLNNDPIHSLDSLSSLSVLGLLSQFEERGKMFLADGLNPTSINQLSAYASGQTTWNMDLAHINPPYATAVRQRLMELYTGKKASYNIVDDFRKQLVGHFVAPSRFAVISDSLIKEIIATKCAIERKFPESKVEELTDTYLMNALRYEAIIAIHTHQIKSGKGKPKDFVQIGNSYVNLGDKDKAIRSFNKAISALRTVGSPAASDEITRLESYVQKINNQ